MSRECLYVCVCQHHLTYDLDFWYDLLSGAIMPSGEVTLWHHGITWICVCLSIYNKKKGLLGKRSVQFGKGGRYVNAQAFWFIFPNSEKTSEVSTIIPTLVSNPSVEMFGKFRHGQFSYQIYVKARCFMEYTSLFSIHTILLNICDKKSNWF